MKKKQGIIPQIADHSKLFSMFFMLIFGLTVLFLWSVGATPDPAKADAEQAQPSRVEKEEITETPQLPARIVINVPGVEVDAKIENPQSTDIAILDQALTKGSVRYPTSAVLGVEGTMLLFGHSSRLPVIYNKAYKAFNDIGDLAAGDSVSVYSTDTEYRYRVASVKFADAEEDVIELPETGRHLILVTCDTFSKKSARFVVTADFVGTYPLAY